MKGFTVCLLNSESGRCRYNWRSAHGNRAGFSDVKAGHVKARVSS